MTEMTTEAKLKDSIHYLEMDFFDGADGLRTQFEKACAAGSRNEMGPLSRVEAGKAYSFLTTTAEQVFSHALVFSFLNRLRGWGMEKIGACHTSTPQVHVYAQGCARAMAPDATPASHHYVYSLAREVPAQIQILATDGSRKNWLGIGVNRLSSVRLGFNSLLVHRADLAYAVQRPREVKSIPGAAVFLHGYIW